MSERDSERDEPIRMSEMSGLDDDARPRELGDDADAGGAAGGEAVDGAERNGVAGGAA